MGCFTPVPRVCRVRCLATGIPEEWLPDRGNTANRTRLTGRLVFSSGDAARHHSIEDRMKEEKARSASKGFAPLEQRPAQSPVRQKFPPCIRSRTKSDTAPASIAPS